MTVEAAEALRARDEEGDGPPKGPTHIEFVYFISCKCPGERRSFQKLLATFSAPDVRAWITDVF